jgi:hypothetical protein
MRFACWINKATDTHTHTHTHTLWICNIYSFSTATVVWREHLRISLCVHWFYIRFQALTFVRSFWLCVSDWPLAFFFHSATNGSSHFINRSLAFVSNSRSAHLSLSVPCATPWLRKLLATRYDSSALLSHFCFATEVESLTWLLATKFVTFHKMIAHIKCLQLSLNLKSSLFCYAPLIPLANVKFSDNQSLPTRFHV